MNRKCLQAVLVVMLSVLVNGYLPMGKMAGSTVYGSEQKEISVKKLLILLSKDCSDAETNAAIMLSSRIKKRSQVSIKILIPNELKNLNSLVQADLYVAIGIPENSAIVNDLMVKLGGKLPVLPENHKIHPESFIVRSGEIDNKNCLLIAGSEPRATIYGVGAMLRGMTYHSDHLTVPEFDLQEKPALWIRGGQASGPGSRARMFGKLRPQTLEEHLEVMEDLMLLGTNTYGGSPEKLKKYGMMTSFGRTANEMPAGFAKEWGADGGRSPKYVCPSNPEARKALLESFDEKFKNSPEYDFFTTNSGDVGGCRCDKCMPWGGTYIELLHEISKRLHKYHPNTKILATNQDLTLKGNEQILNYLNDHDSSWLFAIRYGPGADEMQKYIRGPVNPERFKYEGFGATGNYLKYLHHALPRETNIALYSDITHWMQSQYAVQQPDVTLASLYNRRSWNARPKHFHKVAQEIFHYALGDMHYSEGMHDDFNKWIWYRLLWNPKQDPKTLTDEYCRYWFGPEARDEMTEAIFLMEETLDKPVLGNPGIAKAVILLQSAGQKIPANLLKSDYRWRVISQKALMDLYLQLKLMRGEELKNAAMPILKQIKDSKNPEADLKKTFALLNQPMITDQMKRVMEKARQLGEESNKIVGYRVPAMYVIDRMDLSEVEWWKKNIVKSLSSGNETEIRNSASMILNYDDPGEGGFYENLGWPNEPINFKNGQWLWGFRPFFGPAKNSQYSLAFSFFDPQGVSFSYEGLDPKATYVFRVSIGVHLGDDEESSMLRNIELKQGVSADGQVIGKEFLIPRDDVTYQEFELPEKITSDGKVEINLTSSSKILPITAAYEVWLMKKENMPWSAKP